MSSVAPVMLRPSLAAGFGSFRPPQGNIGVNGVGVHGWRGHDVWVRRKWG